MAVREFRAPAFLINGPIAYHPSPEQVAFYNYHHWAEDPRKAVTAAVIRTLEATAMFRSVDSFDGRGSPECVLTGTLDHLEEVDNGSAVSIKVSLSARLVNVATGELLWQGASSRNAKVDERSVTGVVAEMSNNLGTVVEQLVASMQNHLLETLSAARGSNATQ